MKCLDTRGHWDYILKDDSKKISKEKLEKTCLMYQGDKTCRYIMMGIEGYVCIKNSKLKETIDEHVNEKKMFSLGDNCNGL